MATAKAASHQQRHARVIGAGKMIESGAAFYAVTSQSGDGVHLVVWDEGASAWTCDCRGFAFRRRCAHTQAIRPHVEARRAHVAAMAARCERRIAQAQRIADQTARDLAAANLDRETAPLSRSNAPFSIFKTAEDAVRGLRGGPAVARAREVW